MHARTKVGVWAVATHLRDTYWCGIFLGILPLASTEYKELLLHLWIHYLHVTNPQMMLHPRLPP